MIPGSGSRRRRRGSGGGGGAKFVSIRICYPNTGCCATFPTHARPSRPVPDRQTGAPSSFFHLFIPCCPLATALTQLIPFSAESRPFSLLSRVLGISSTQCARMPSCSLARRESHLWCRAAAGPCVHAAQSRSRGAEQLPFMAIPGHTYEGSGAALEAGGRQPEPGIKLVRPCAASLPRSRIEMRVLDRRSHRRR